MSHDGKAEDTTRQPEQIRAFRDTWRLGIHSYLAYLRDRLTIARELLTDTGSVFVQIGDENVHLVRSMLDEVFGSENFVALYFSVSQRYHRSTLLHRRLSSLVCEESTVLKYRQLFSPKVRGVTGRSNLLRRVSGT